MSFDLPENLHYAHFFFIDVVGASNPETSTSTQIIKLKILNNLISDSKTFRSVGRDKKLLQPTGDGMVIGFLQGSTLPLELAIEISENLIGYNEKKSNLDKIHVRIGCHSGEVFTFNDIYNNTNIWGPGIIIAKRIMDLGDQDHILMSSSMAESLFSLLESYKTKIHPVNDFELKHGEIVLLYSVYDDKIGNSQRPSKTVSNKVKKLDDTNYKNALNYDRINLDIILKEVKSNLVRIKTTYHLVNNSTEPIYKMIFTLITNLEKDFDKLLLKAYDEDQQELIIESIVGGSFETEITVKLNHPLLEEKDRFCYFDYELKESDHFFENFFTSKCNELVVSFSFPSDSNIINPSLNLIRYQYRTKEKIDFNPKIKRGMKTQITWDNINEIKPKDILRLEW